MFFIVSKAISFLFRPIVWIFIFLLLSLMKKEKRKKFLILGITSFYFFCNGFIVDEFSRFWEIPRANITEVYDVGIVLGGLADYDTITKPLISIIELTDYLMQSDYTIREKLKV